MTQESKKKTSFIIYESFYEPIKSLSDEKMGKLFRAIFEYRINGTTEVPEDVAIAFSFFKNQLDIDTQKYEEVCKKRAISGSTGGKQKVANASKCYQVQANATKCKQKVANLADNDNDNDNDNEYDNEYDNDNVNEYENVNENDNENENDNVKPKKNKPTKTTSEKLEEKLPEIIKNLNLDEEYVELTRSWIKYKRDLKEGYKSEFSLIAFVKRLAEFSNNQPEVARRVIEQSFERNWKTVYKLQENSFKGKPVTSNEINYKCDFIQPDGTFYNPYL